MGNAALAQIDWDFVKSFKQTDFPENPNSYAEPELIHTLQKYRAVVQKSIFPSPVEGALARFSGKETTEHFVGPAANPVRKSKAVDIFVEGIPIQNLQLLWRFPEIKGIGIYVHTTGPDGKPWVMFHIDIRENGFSPGIPLFWICEKIWSVEKKKRVDAYRYPQTEPKFWNLLQNEIMYANKQHGKHPGLGVA